jgi:hypothetical protein
MRRSVLALLLVSACHRSDGSRADSPDAGESSAEVDASAPPRDTRASSPDRPAAADGAIEEEGGTGIEVRQLARGPVHIALVASDEQHLVYTLDDLGPGGGGYCSYGRVATATIEGNKVTTAALPGRPHLLELRISDEARSYAYLTAAADTCPDQITVWAAPFGGAPVAVGKGEGVEQLWPVGGALTWRQENFGGGRAAERAVPFGQTTPVALSEKGDDGTVELDPTGRRAFVKHSTLGSSSPDSSELVTLGPPAVRVPVKGDQVVWSPDGKRMMMAVPTPDGQSHTLHFSSNGTDLEPLLADCADCEFDTFLSGERALLVRPKGTGVEYVVRGFDGRAPLTLAIDEGDTRVGESYAPGEAGGGRYFYRQVHYGNDHRLLVADTTHSGHFQAFRFTSSLNHTFFSPVGDQVAMEITPSQGESEVWIGDLATGQMRKLPFARALLIGYQPVPPHRLALAVDFKATATYGYGLGKLMFLPTDGQGAGTIVDQTIHMVQRGPNFVWLSRHWSGEPAFWVGRHLIYTRAVRKDATLMTLVAASEDGPPVELPAQADDVYLREGGPLRRLFLTDGQGVLWAATFPNP